MKSALTPAQFTEAVFRQYHGETLKEIAEDFGISPNTLKSIKSRKSREWNRQREALIRAHLSELSETRRQQTQAETEREQKAFDLISEVLDRRGYFRGVKIFLSEHRGYPPSEAETLILAYAKRHKV